MPTLKKLLISESAECLGMLSEVELLQFARVCKQEIHAEQELQVEIWREPPLLDPPLFSDLKALGCSF